MARLTPRRVLFPLVAVALLSAGLLGGCDNAGPAGASFKAVDITGADYAQTLDLPDADGRMRTLAEFKGKVAVVFFGFTQCPDVCPATLSTVAAALRRLPVEVADQFRPVLITVDPKTDNAQVLARYVAGFDARIHGLTGDPALLQKIADSYGAVVGREKATDHTSLLYLVSADGEVLRTFLPGAPPQEIAVAIEMAVRG